MAKVDLPPGEGLYPLPVVLVSCIDKKSKKPNVITIAWCGVICSNPPQISISIRPSRYSHKLISQTGDFVVNIPTKNLVREADMCGMRSGKDVDKFHITSLATIPSTKVSSPMIKECPVNIECVLKKVIKLGTHDMFIGVVVAVHADKEVIGASGSIDFRAAAPFVYNNGEYWDLAKKIGYYGFSDK